MAPLGNGRRNDRLRGMGVRPPHDTLYLTDMVFPGIGRSHGPHHLDRPWIAGAAVRQAAQSVKVSLKDCWWNDALMVSDYAGLRLHLSLHNAYLAVFVV